MERPLDRRLLATLEPIRDLDPEGQEEIARNTLLRALPAGGRLFNAGERDDWTYYLLRGEVDLADEGRLCGRISGGTPKARKPIAPEQPRCFTARARTAIAYVRVPTSLLEMLAGPAGGAQIETSELHDDDEELTNRLLFEIHQDYLNDRLSVPMLPDVALRVREAVKDPNITNARLEKLAAGDPSIAARLIKVANSPAYRGRSGVETCRDAIARLGLNATQEVVTALALKELFKTGSPMLAARMQALWAHSTLVAALSALLAARTRGVNPELAMLAGLVHDIGAVSVLTRAESHRELLDDPAHLEQAIAELRAQFGAMILRKWEFPDAIVTTALEAEDWMRDPEGGPDCCDVVLLAQLLIYAGTPAMSGYPEPNEVPAARKLELGELSPERCTELLEEASASVADLQSALG